MSAADDILTAMDEVDRQSAILRSRCFRLIELLRTHDQRVLSHDSSVVGVIGPRPTDDPPSSPA